MYVLSVDSKECYKNAKDVLVEFYPSFKSVLVVVVVFAASFWAVPFASNFMSFMFYSYLESIGHFFGLPYEDKEKMARILSLLKGIAFIVIFIIVCIFLFIKLLKFVKT